MGIISCVGIGVGCVGNIMAVGVDLVTGTGISVVGGVVAGVQAAKIMTKNMPKEKYLGLFIYFS